MQKQHNPETFIQRESNFKVNLGFNLAHSPKTFKHFNLAHSRAHLGQLEQPPPHPLVPPSEDIQAGPRISWTPLLLHPKTKKESKRATSQGGSRAFLQRSSTFLPPLTPSQSSWPSLPEQPPPRPFTVVFHFLPFQSILNLWISLHITGIWKENHLSWKKLIKNHECLPHSPYKGLPNVQSALFLATLNHLFTQPSTLLLRTNLQLQFAICQCVSFADKSCSCCTKCHHRWRKHRNALGFCYTSRSVKRGASSL